MKSIIRLCAVVMAAVLPLFGVLPACAAEVSNESVGSYVERFGDYEGFTAGNSLCLTRYCADDTNVTVPAQINGYKVVELYTSSPYDEPFCDGVFRRSYRLESADLPDTLVDIGDDSFYGCHTLKSVKLGNSLGSIGYWAFAYTGVESVDIPASVTDIKPAAFGFCRELREFSVSPENRCFKSVDGVLFNKDMTELVAFPGAKGGSYTIPDTVKTIRPQAFAGCGKVTQVVIPDSVTTVGYRCFEDCDAITELIFPDSVKSIDMMAVADCDGLTNVRLPGELSSLPMSMLQCCSGLRSVDIPQSVKAIGFDAFGACASLETIDVPDSVEAIDFAAFSECPKLIIICGKDTAAHVFVREYEIPYLLRGGEDIGDIDHDGSVTSGDALMILRCSASLSELSADQRQRADLDKDGHTTSGDALMALRTSISIQDGRTADEPAKEVKAEDAAQGARSFGAEAFRRIYKPGENSLLSPVSLYIALAMLENGAADTTQTELLDMLTAHGDFGEDDINSFVKEYMEYHNENDTLNIANMVYVTNDERVEIMPEFEDTVRSVYSADVMTAAPNDATVDRINSWVSEHTNGAIKRVMSHGDLTMDTNTVLINTTAFDGKWKKAYNSSAVYTGEFTNYDGTVSEAEFMRENGNWYYDDGRALAFKKAYNDSYSFIGILPNEDVGVDGYAADLDGSTIQNLLDNAKCGEVFTELPKFEFDKNYDLVDTLTAMGMVSAFDSSLSNFDRLTKVDADDMALYVDKVRQFTHIKLDENGTKAEAATVISVEIETSIAYEDYVEIYLDRPFLFVIYDDEHDMPVFIGSVADMRSF